VRVDSFVIPASENLHISGSRQSPVSEFYCVRTATLVDPQPSILDIGLDHG
jgi:hypothetical protein